MKEKEVTKDKDAKTMERMDCLKEVSQKRQEREDVEFVWAIDRELDMPRSKIRVPIDCQKNKNKYWV